MESKAAAIYIVLVVLFAGMISRIYVLTLGDSLASAAQNQSAYILQVDTSRGMIYDCAMQPLVNHSKKLIAAIQPSAEANAALAQVKNESDGNFTFDPQATRPYTVELPEEEVYAKNIELFEGYARYDEEQLLAPHIIGYLNGDKTDGIAGIELSYNELLKKYGGVLNLRYFIDALGHPAGNQAPEIIMNNYQNQGGVVLTLNADFQRAAQNAMKDVEKGAVVIMDVNTGDIKASVSMPAYDPNNLSKSLKDPDSPFVNRAFSQYNVGSTFKLVTAAAALENGFGRYNPYTCQGYVDVDGHTFYCHWRNGHGEIALKKAIEVSCNPFFINMGLTAGGKKIASMAREIGFTRAAHLTDDMVTQPGTLPSNTELRSDTAVANFAFGQGKLTATPIQIAQMVSTVANGGYAVTPRLVEGFTSDGKTIEEHTTAYSPVQVFSKETSDILRECMVANVEEGSGVQAKPLRGMAGGKTASAQTGIYLTPGEEDSEIVHAWFAGYYPAQTPKYAIVVLVEGGESGSDAAAPIFKRIADAIYLAEL